MVRAPGLAPECLDDGARVVDADGRDEDGQIHARRAEGRELLLAAREWSRQAHRVQDPIAQGGTAHVLLHLVRFPREAARAEEPLEERERGVEAEVGARRLPHGAEVVADEGGEAEGHVDLAQIRRLRAALLDPRAALLHALGGPEKWHDAVRQLARELDGARSDGRHVEGHALGRGTLGQVSRGTFALEPAAHRGHVAPERDRRVAHLDAERGVDGRMAHAETEHEAAIGGVGDESGALGARVGVAKVDVGDPRADLEASGGRAHELGGGQDVVVHLGGKDRVEACLLRLARDGLDLTGAPACTGNDCESEPISHGGLLSSEAGGTLARGHPALRPPARRDDCRASITGLRRGPRPPYGTAEASHPPPAAEARQGGAAHQPFTRRTSAETDRSAKTTRRNRAGSSLPKRATPAATPARAGAAKTAVASQTSRVIKPAHQ